MGVLLRHQFGLADAAVDGRTLDMALVPVGRAAYVVDDDGQPYREMFTDRSFAHVDPTRVELRYTHQPDLLNDVGRGMAGGLFVDGGYWRASMTVARGNRGDHVLDLFDSGMVGGVSIGFEPGVDRAQVDSDGPVVVRAKVRRLEHVALVGPAERAQYPDARVLARRAVEDAARAELREWIDRHRRGA